MTSNKKCERVEWLQPWPNHDLTKLCVKHLHGILHELPEEDGQDNNLIWRVSLMP